jgi:predicted RNA-binding protein with PIN domain
VGKKLEAVREAFIQKVSRVYAQKKMKIVVVFDGRAEFGSSTIHYPNVTVKFSRHPETADDVINTIIRNCKNPKQLTVVSSDAKDIGRVAKAHGVALWNADDFLNHLFKEKEASTGSAATNNNRKLSPDEIDSWLTYLGIDTNESKAHGKIYFALQLLKCFFQAFLISSFRSSTIF